MNKSLGDSGIWGSSLCLNEMDIKDSLCGELAEYEKIDVSLLQQRLDKCKDELNKQWNEFGYKDPKKFYQTTRWYLYDLTLFHINFNRQHVVEEVLNFCREKGLMSIMDFGCGIGSMSIVFAKKGLSVTLADVSRISLDYARFRFNLRDLKADFINISSESLADESVEVIFANDVFEHLDKPRKELYILRNALKNNGYLMFNITQTDEDKTHPMHITLPFDVFKDLRKAGFSKVFTRKGLHCYKKKDRPCLVNNLLGVYDTIYFWLRCKLKKLL